MKTVKTVIKDKHMRRVQNQILNEIKRKLALPYIPLLPKEHAAIVRKAFRKQFPDTTWKVTFRSFNWGATIDVKAQQTLKDKAYFQAQHLVDGLNGFSEDLLGDCYNTGFEYGGKRYRGALFCKLVC